MAARASLRSRRGGDGGPCVVVGDFGSCIRGGSAKFGYSVLDELLAGGAGGIAFQP